MLRNKYFNEKISRQNNYQDNKFSHIVWFGNRIGKISYGKLLKQFKKYDDNYDRISEASDNNNGKVYRKVMSGYINKSYKISEQQFLIKNKKNKFSEFCEDN